ncbi:hypothetical protein FACS189496_5610 [Bacilli bacterium]|nr:hypothetical protein FACS189496_5610 [Bacilli bacterium]
MYLAMHLVSVKFCASSRGYTLEAIELVWLKVVVWYYLMLWIYFDGYWVKFLSLFLFIYLFGGYEILILKLGLDTLLFLDVNVLPE